MLDNTPDTGADRKTNLLDDDTLHCVACDAEIARTRWTIRRNDDHEHTVFNPAGQVFTILCFREAPDVAAVGDPSGEFTWFKGFEWKIVLCRGCNAHLGWQYIGTDIFFGLIKPELALKQND